MHLGFRAAAILVALATLLASCSASPTATPEPTLDGPAFPYEGEFALLGPDGALEETTSVARLLADGKPLVLNLWAGACPPCRMEMPDLQAAYEEYADRVTFFGLDVGSMANLGTVEDAVALLAEFNVTYPAGTSSDLALLRSLSVTGVPATLFITTDGRVVSGWVGMLDRETLSTLVDDLLRASPQAEAAP